jgi:hypothetical protein
VKLIAKFHFLLEEAIEVMPASELNGGMKRSEGLHKNFAFDIATASAAGDLREQLKGAFPGSEVGLMEREIGVDDSDEGHSWKMQSLCDHLGSDEDINFARAKIAKDTPEVVFAF